MIIDPNRVYSGFSNVAAGVDGGRSPDLIEQNQCAEMENMVCRGGKATTRPGFRAPDIEFEDEVYFKLNGAVDDVPAGPASISTEAAFKTKVFQCACYYTPPNQPACIMALIGGRLFRIEPMMNNILKVSEFIVENQTSRRYVTDFSGFATGLAPILRNSERLNMAYMCQADRFLIAQDGESLPIIFDGVKARRAEDDEVVVGTIMAYGQGRLVVVRDQDIFFGDLYGSHDLPTAGESVLKFTETTFLNEGFPASISSSFGKITAAFFTPQQDSATGDGELLVAAERGVSSFFVSQPREQWKESAFQRIALQNVGVRGHRSPVSKNGDVWFRADDGCRSYRQARSEISGWAHLPLSTEVRKWIENDTAWMLQYASAVTHENRIYFTCTPQPNQGQPFHEGLLSLDFDVLSSFGQASKPAWDGHFSGMRVTQLVVGKFNRDERAFAFALDENDENSIYEITHDDPHDFSGPIPWSITGRSLPFESSGGQEMPFNLKELYQADLWVDNVNDTPVTPVLEYRPDQAQDFVPWGTFAQINPNGTCGTTNCGGCPTIKSGFRPRLQLGKPPDDCDDAQTKRFYRLGYEFQPRLSGTGHCSIRKLRLHGQMPVENPQAPCDN